MVKYSAGRKSVKSVSKKNVKSAEKKKVVNPKTGKSIQQGGATYNRLTVSEKKKADQSVAAPQNALNKKATKAATKGEKKSKYFSASAEKSLSESHKKYCRCIAHIAAKQSASCNASSSSSTQRGKGCVNPYAVCTKVVGRSGPGSGECLQYYDLGAIPKDEVEALAVLKTKSKNVKALYAKQKKAIAK